MHSSAPSSLKSQLQHKVSQKRHAIEDIFNRKSVGSKQGNYLVPSLLYTPSIAADQVPEFLFERATNAIAELSKSYSWWKLHHNEILNNFLIFTNGPLIDRASLTTTESEKISEEVILILKALLPCLLVEESHVPSSSISAKSPLHILEFFCRRLRAHEFETDDLIFTALLYHETSLFKLVIGLIKFNKYPEWAFLGKFLESNIPITREFLVSQLANSNGFLLGKFHTFVRSIIYTGNDNNGLFSALDYRNLISFFSAIYYESILKISHDPKKQSLRLSILTNILKNIKGSRKDIFKDWYISQLLLLIPLLYALDLTASRQTENNGQESMAQFIIRQLVRYEHPLTRPYTLSLICCICQLFFEQAIKTNSQLIIDFSSLENISQWQNIDTVLLSVITNLESTAFTTTIQNSFAVIPSALLEKNTNINILIPYFTKPKRL